VLREHFVEQISALLGSIHSALHEAAKQRLLDNIRTDIVSFEALAEHFKTADGGSADEDSANAEFRGWARVAWARPQGAALAKVEQQLKGLKLTVRNAPLAQEPITDQRCVFSGEPAREFVLVGRSY
jgi:prolyl-tRNA synthetase